VDPESSAALALEEFDFCADLVITAGNECTEIRDCISIWRDSLQDLRDIPIGALLMLADLGWDFARDQSEISIFSNNQDTIRLLDQRCDGFSTEFLQTLATTPEMIISGCSEQPQEENDKILEALIIPLDSPERLPKRISSRREQFIFLTKSTVRTWHFAIVTPLANT
jgi:hypothetical protein